MFSFFRTQTGSYVVAILFFFISIGLYYAGLISEPLRQMCLPLAFVVQILLYGRNWGVSFIRPVGFCLAVLLMLGGGYYLAQIGRIDSNLFTGCISIAIGLMFLFDRWMDHE